MHEYDPHKPLEPTPRPVDPIQDKGRTVIVKNSGDRALLLGPGDINKERGAYISTAFSRHLYGWQPLANLELAEPKAKRGGFDLKEDLEPIMSGILQVPNWQPVEDQGRALGNLTLGGLYTPAGSGAALLPGTDSTAWAKYFLNTMQGGGFSGGGYIIVYQGGTAVIGKFAICEHKKVEGAGADHRRGWHPGSCEKCGLDMTVDSGD